MHYQGQMGANPAFAGSSGNINLAAVNRNQWLGFEGAPKTTVAGVDGSIKVFDRFHGFGLVISNDEIGAFNSLMMNINYSYQIELEEGILGLGMRIGMINTKFDGSKLNPMPGQKNDDYHQNDDQAILKASTNGSAADIGLGAHYQTPKFYAGLSVLHLNSPKPSFDSDLSWKVKPAIFLGSGYLMALRDKKYAIEPRIMIKSDFATWQYEIGAALHYSENLWGAIGYRNREAIILQIGGLVFGQVKMAYGYDLNTSKMAGYQGGTHEIALGYNFDLSLEKKSKAYKSVRFL